MAVGPLISFPLQKVPDTLHHGIRINPITCAGYVMAAAWLVFALICQLFFQEPLDVIRHVNLTVRQLMLPLKILYPCPIAVNESLRLAFTTSILALVSMPCCFTKVMQKGMRCLLTNPSIFQQAPFVLIL